MSYFLSNQPLATNTKITLTGEEAAHISLSRRIRPGDEIQLQGSNGKRFNTKVLEANKDMVKVMVADEVAVPQELETQITIFQSVISEKALDFIFQKATELGAAEIVLFNSQNTAIRMTEEMFENKYDRWNKILWEAAKQSERGTVPKLSFKPTVADVVSSMHEYKNFFVLESEGESLSSSASTINFESPLAIVVGPEGGFTEEEVDQLSTGPTAKRISLGPFVLRSETAAISGLSMILTKI